MLRTYIRLVQLVFIYGCGLFFQGCNIINPPEKVPTYIHVDSFIMDPNPYLSTSNVTTSHQITSVWAFYNGTAIGAFDLPATFPVMTNADTGTGQLTLEPGIDVNGQNNTVGPYPFYQNDISTFTIQPGKIINYIPHTSFFNNTKVTKLSYFDGPVGFSLWAGNIPMVKVNDPSLVFPGCIGAGSITLVNVGDSSIDSSVTPFVIPPGAAYIEFNYKNDIPFYIGLQANLSSFISAQPFYLEGIKRSNTWQKFYFYLTDFANEYKGTSYNLYIKAVYPGQTGGRILLDNIQLVTF